MKRLRPGFRKPHLQRRLLRILLSGSLLCGMLLSGCADTTDPLETGERALLLAGSSYADAVELHRISDDVWMHVTYLEDGETLSSQNGLVRVTEDGLMLVNLTMDAIRTRQLVHLAETSFGAPVQAVLLTRLAPDCLGGLSELAASGTEVWVSGRMANHSALAGLSVHVLSGGKVPMGKKELESGEDMQTKGVPEEVSPPVQLPNGLTVQWLSPGIPAYQTGKTPSSSEVPSGTEPSSREDSVAETLWFPEDALLYTCNLFYALDAPLPEALPSKTIFTWASSLQDVLRFTGDTAICVPGSGQWGTSDLMTYTRDRLLEELSKEERRKWEEAQAF